MICYERLRFWRAMPVLRIAEVGALLAISRSQVARLEAAGKLERAVVTDGVVHYRTESVVRLVDSQRIAQASERAQESQSRAARRQTERRFRDLQKRIGVV